MVASIPAEAPSHEIIVVRTEKEKQQCWATRIIVYHLEQGFPIDGEIDQFETTASHFLLRLTPSLEPIGTFRGFLYPSVDSEGEQFYKLTCLAPRKEYRQYGLGRKMVDFLHNWIREGAKRRGFEGAVKVVANSQLHAIKFYERFGYVAEGDHFDDAGQPHQRLVLRLPLYIR